MGFTWVAVCLPTFALEVVAAKNFSLLQDESVFWVDAYSESGMSGYGDVFVEREIYAPHNLVEEELKVVTYNGIPSFEVDKTRLDIVDGKQPTVGQEYTICSWIRWAKVAEPVDSARMGGRAMVGVDSYIFGLTSKRELMMGVAAYHITCLKCLQPDCGNAEVSQTPCEKVETEKWMLVCVVSVEGYSGSKFYTGTTDLSATLRGVVQNSVKGAKLTSIGAREIHGPGRVAWMGYWSRSLSLQEMEVLRIGRPNGERAPSPPSPPATTSQPSPVLAPAPAPAEAPSSNELDEVSKAYHAPMAKGATALVMAVVVGFAFCV